MAKISKSSSVNDEVAKLINKINEQNPYLLVGLVVGVILVLYYFVFLQGKISEVSAINSEIASLKQSLDVTKNDIQRIAQYRSELDNYRAKIAALGKKIKGKEEIPLALEQLSHTASQFGVKIEQVMPNPERGEVLVKNDEGKFIAVPIIIGARSTYHNFGKFLNSIERQGIFLKIPDFGIMTNPESHQQHLVKLVLQVVIFEKKDKSEKEKGK